MCSPSVCCSFVVAVSINRHAGGARCLCDHLTVVYVPLPAVFVVKVDPNYAQPWQKCPQRSSSGSAFVLDTQKRMIITNAHVVGLSRAVLCQAGRPKTNQPLGCLHAKGCPYRHACSHLGVTGLQCIACTTG